MNTVKNLLLLAILCVELLCLLAVSGVAAPVVCDDKCRMRKHFMLYSPGANPFGVVHMHHTCLSCVNGACFGTLGDHNTDGTCTDNTELANRFALVPSDPICDPTGMVTVEAYGHLPTDYPYATVNVFECK